MHTTVSEGFASTIVLSFARQGRVGVGESINPRLDEALRKHHISPRQRQLIFSLLEGKSNKRIARVLGNTEATVKIQMKSILQKLRLENRTQVAMWAIQNGYSPELSGKSPCAVKLTDHQAWLLRLLTDGLTNRQIAETMEIEESTVKAETRALFKKIGASNRTMAAIWAVAHGHSYFRQCA